MATHFMHIVLSGRCMVYEGCTVDLIFQFITRFYQQCVQICIVLEQD